MELKQHQPALTVEEQIDNLISKGLIINDKDEAKAFLNDVSYFRVIKAYSLRLKEKNGNYHEGVTFDQIVDLYKFNCNFRQLLFAVIERVEVNLRCRIANYFSSKYGVLGYNNSENFENEEYFNDFIDDINKEISRNNRNPFVRNFQNKYVDGAIPMYALVELFSFGTLSKFYKNMKSEDKKAIAKTYNVGYSYLESWFECIAYVRNICAHYGRLYNAKLSKTPILYRQYLTANIRNNRVFSIMLCISYLVPHDEHWKIFVDETETLIKKYKSVDITKMGFPENWKELLLHE